MVENLALDFMAFRVWNDTQPLVQAAADRRGLLGLDAREHTPARVRRGWGALMRRLAPSIGRAPAALAGQ